MKVKLMQHQVKTVVVQMDVNGRYNLEHDYIYHLRAKVLLLTK